MRAELLAPAGSLEGLKGVIQAGADAVYIGGTQFGARAYAENPEQEELLDALDYVHIHGKRMYLTVNTLLKNTELYGNLYAFLAPYYERGLDAVIVQDLGVLSFIKEEFPGLPIHASTQMTLTGPEGVRLIQRAGASRIVTARELSLKEIRQIYDATQVEIESFVHGALCYCYSGMCLFSSLLGGRSGNRGRCAQPCRLPYTAYEKGRSISGQKPSYLLSPKDMCTIEILPEILNAGVYSLKIEGRMKRPEYAAGVTAVYRKYLDLYEKNPAHYQVEPKDYQELLDLYQRDGFHQGYYTVHNKKEMIAVKNEKEQARRKKIPGIRNEALFERLRKQYLETKKQEKINGNLILFTDSPAILEIDFQGISIQVTGETVQKGKTQPLSAERARRQMEKTGGTPFVFEHLEIFTDEKGFLPMQAFNELRRQGLSEIQAAYLEQFHRVLPQKQQAEKPVCAAPASALKVYVSVETREQWRAALAHAFPDGIYYSLSMCSFPHFAEQVCRLAKQAHQAGKEFYLALPYMLREDRFHGLETQFEEISPKIDGLLIRNLEEAGYLQKLGLLGQAVADYSIYSFNDHAQRFLENLGIKRTTVSLELNQKEIARKQPGNSERIVYGYYPMMVSAQCVKKTCSACDRKNGSVFLKDRYDRQFLTKCFCDFCYNVIYNSVPAGLLEEAEQVLSIGVSAVRMNFTAEKEEETRRLLDLFQEAYRPIDQTKKRNIPQKPLFTKGHFRRGVE